MTNARRFAMHVLILAVLLFMGSSASSEVDDSLLSEVLLNPLEDAEAKGNMSKKPSLQPKEKPPLIATYTLKKDGRVCIMARLGVEFVVKENKDSISIELQINGFDHDSKRTIYRTSFAAMNSVGVKSGNLRDIYNTPRTWLSSKPGYSNPEKTLYLNLDPKSTTATGYCTDQKAFLSLIFDGGNLDFTFIKNGDQSYVSTVRVVLNPEPSCKQCKGKSYPGIVDHEKLFKTNKGQSFKCQSKTSLKLAENLTIKLIPMQVQAFDLSKGSFGKEMECLADYTKRIMPIVVGAVVAGIILIGILVYVLLRERHNQGYEQL